MRSSDRKRLRFSGALSGLCVNQFLNADEHSLASSARSNCVHEQAAKLGPVSRAAGMDCEWPLYLQTAEKQKHNVDARPYIEVL